MGVLVHYHLNLSLRQTINLAISTLLINLLKRLHSHELFKYQPQVFSQPWSVVVVMHRGVPDIEAEYLDCNLLSFLICKD